MTTSTATFDLDLTTAAGATGIDALRGHVLGEVITPDSAGYDAGRRVHNLTVDRLPAAILRAQTVHDVVQAVRFAREHGYLVAVRSGGHSLAGYGVADGALVVDLSAMRAVEIDPAGRKARVQAGANSGDLAVAAHKHNLALSTGDTASVGLGGLATGGGIGWMVRKYGLAIDNLLSARVVTADGQLVTASAEEHPDLFWAIRGGGGNFGIVVEFEFRLAQVCSVLGGVVALPASREVVRGYLEYAARAPEELSTIANLMPAPPAPFIPNERIGEPVLMVQVCWVGDSAAGRAALEPLRALAAPVADAVYEMPYPAMYSFTAAASEPHAAAIRSMYADHLDDAMLDAALAAVEAHTSPVSMVQFRALGGAMARVGAGDTAFGHRDRRYFVSAIAVWLDANDDGRSHEAWVDALWQQLRPAARGVYVNFLMDEGASRVREAYPPATFERLAAIKRAYDPTNLFCFNQNIPPAMPRTAANQ